MKWALLDDDGEVVRFVDYPSEGTVQWPPIPKQLDKDDPEWFNIPF
jgi:hypothetical protein